MFAHLIFECLNENNVQVFCKLSFKSWKDFFKWLIFNIFYECITYLIVSVQIFVVAVLVLLLIYCGKKLKRRGKTKIVSQISNPLYFIIFFLREVIMHGLGKFLCCKFLQFSIINGKNICTMIILFDYSVYLGSRKSL